MFKDCIASTLLPWQQGSGADNDVVLDSRVRLVRNLREYRFPNRASKAELGAAETAVVAAVPRLDAISAGEYECIKMPALTNAERELTATKHFISAALMNVPEHRAVIVREDGAVSVMVNEADHIVVQTAAAGFTVQKAADDALRVDDALEETLNYAFHEEFGYLTASPSMAGTGFLAGVTLHLPGLAAMKRLHRITQGITKFGFVFMGVYSSRNTYIGNVFQITNQVTLGVTEEDIVTQLKKIVAHIIQEERACRALLQANEPDTVRDRLLRSYGLLSQAWLMEHEEALNLLSDFQLATTMGLIKAKPHAYTALAAVCEPAYIRAVGKSGLGEEAKVRARLLRDTLQEYKD